MKKRILTLILAATIGISAFVACDDSEKDYNRKNDKIGETEDTAETEDEVAKPENTDSEDKTSEEDTYISESETAIFDTDFETETSVFSEEETKVSVGETENMGEETETEAEEVNPAKIFDTFYGVNYFENKVDIANTKKVVGEADGIEFVRYARTAEFQDGFYVFANAEKTKTRGRYLIMKYRTDHMNLGEIWANTYQASHGNGKAYSLQSFQADGKWHIMILDLEAVMPGTVASDGDYMMKYFRIDFLNTKASRGYMDIAYVALCNDLSAASEYVTDEEQSICNHYIVTSAGKALCEVCGYSADLGEGSVGLQFTPNGDGGCFVSGIGSCTDKNIIIPAKSPSGQKVTRIGGGAFEGQSQIKSVTIPITVVSISSTAFENCTSLESISIPDSVTFIGCMAFSGCSSLKNIVIPDSVTDIQSGVFYKCSSLQSITVPFVGYPGDDEYSGKLYDFFGFEEDIPYSLRSVTVTNSKKISPEAFKGCKYLTSITLCEGIETIGGEAFSGCSNLYTVNLPESIAKISGSAFDGCERLEYNLYEGGKYLGNSKNLYVALMDGRDTKTVHPSAKYIGFEAFRTTYIKSIVIPEGVRHIDNKAFDNGQYLSSVTLPNSLISIGEGAFNGCSELREVIFGDSPQLESIGYEAFRYCSLLESITIPASVNTIAPDAFRACYELKNAYFESGEGWWTSPYDVNASFFDQSLVKDVDSSVLATCPDEAADMLISSSSYWYKRK